MPDPLPSACPPPALAGQSPLLYVLHINLPESSSCSMLGVMPSIRRPAARAPQPLSRRPAAGASSARGLLFPLLGEFVLTGDGNAWTSAVIAAFERLGAEEKATRQALMRTAAAGWLRAEKVGRRTRWHLTDAARRLLTDGAERIYSFTGSAENRGGRWLLVAARSPGGGRRARHPACTPPSWA